MRRFLLGLDCPTCLAQGDDEIFPLRLGNFIFEDEDQGLGKLFKKPVNVYAEIKQPTPLEDKPAKPVAAVNPGSTTGESNGKPVDADDEELLQDDADSTQ